MPKTDDTLMDEIFGSEDQAVDFEEQKQDEVQEQDESGAEDEHLEPVEEEPQQEPLQQQQQQERLYAGKYKSVEDLEKAYQEAQKWGTQSAQQVAALRKELEDLRNQVAPAMTQKQEQQWKKQVQAAINAAVVDEDPSALIALIGQVADRVAEQKLAQRYQDVAPLVQQRKFQQEINDFLEENPDAVEHMDGIAKLIQQDPGLVSKPGWLYRAYGKVLSQKFNAKEQHQVSAAAQIEAQKKAASMPSSTSRKKQEKKDPEQELLDQIFGSPQKGGIFG